MRGVIALLVCVFMTGCASWRHAPPDCGGDYRPINQQQQPAAAKEASNG